jgi:hypothetical protein
MAGTKFLLLVMIKLTKNVSEVLQNANITHIASVHTLPHLHQHGAPTVVCSSVHYAI